MKLAENLNEKWAPVLDHPDLPKITDSHKRAVTAMCLENTEHQYVQDQAMQGQSGLLSEATPTTINALIDSK
jgi:hypothetical protein